jgi:GntR family transcriptional regulator, transcriptional repressor for pyruvate dehydrogenase complex
MLDKELFQSQKRESTVDFVINSIKRLLLTKKLMPGDMLPNETELAESFNVSRGSIREAMKILSAFGIVEVKRGDGTYIAESSSKTLLDPFLFNLILSNAEPREMEELRELIELQVIRLIVKNAGDKELEHIKDVHREMQKLVKQNGGLTPQTLVECDMKFHAALGQATGNVLVEKIYGFILELFAPYIEKTYSQEKNEFNAFELHEAIINSLDKRDLNNALEATQKSIEEWRRLFNNDN